MSDFDVDLSLSYGRNTVDFRTLNSANYAYGSSTPRNFYDGAVAYDQYVAGLDVTGVAVTGNAIWAADTSLA